MMWLKNTRAYAKRQITWFKKEDGILWFRQEEQLLWDKVGDFLEDSCFLVEEGS
jgi:tRNA dimethylallyltransferase